MKEEENGIEIKRKKSWIYDIIILIIPP